MRHLLTDLRGNPIYVMSRAARLRKRNVVPALFCLVKNRAWADVIRRSKSHPHEVVFQEDASKSSALHIACRLDPPKEVILALRKASRMKNAQGCTPLHIAASHRISEASLEVLLECASETNTATNNIEAKRSSFFMPQYDSYKSQNPTADLSACGRSPIHYACLSFRGLETNAFRKLLEATLEHGTVVVDDEAYSKKLLGLDDFFNEDEEMMQSTTSFDSPVQKKTINVMTLRDSSGQTPLGLLFRRYRERMRCVINTVDRLWKEHAGNPNKASLAAAISVHAELGELWQRARFILGRLTEERIQKESGDVDGASSDGEKKTCFLDMDQPLSPGELAVAHEAASWAAEQHNMDVMFRDAASLEQENRDASPGRRRDSLESHTFRIVHASVGLIGYGCPPEMIRLAISLHPQQVKEMDEDGNLPIHIAATARSYLATNYAGAANDKSTLAAAAAAAVAASDEDSMVSDTTGVLSFFSTATVSQTINAFDKVIKILIQHYPESAKVPQGKTGRLPLVMAVEAGYRSWNDGIQTLLSAYPPAIHNQKLFSLPLFPNVLSMVINNGNAGTCGGGGRDEDSISSKKIASGGNASMRSNTIRSPIRNKRVHKNKNNIMSRKHLTTMFELLKVKPELLIAHRNKEG